MSPWRYRNTWFLFALYRLGRSDQEALRISGKNTKVVLDLCCVWNCISAVIYSYSDGVDIINGTRVSLATVDKFSLRVTKVTQNLPFRFLYSRIYLPAACFPLIYHQHYLKSMVVASLSPWSSVSTSFLYAFLLWRLPFLKTQYLEVIRIKLYVMKKVWFSEIRRHLYNF